MFRWRKSGAGSGCDPPRSIPPCRGARPGASRSRRPGTDRCGPGTFRRDRPRRCASNHLISSASSLSTTGVKLTDPQPRRPLGAAEPSKPFSITTICLSRINHLRISLCPSIVHCGQGGIRFALYPKLASFRISRAPAAARFRGPGVPSRQSAHFGFVPSSGQGGQCQPAIIASSVALRLKNAAFRRHSCGSTR
jgi:hypothetical protein